MMAINTFIMPLSTATGMLERSSRDAFKPWLIGISVMKKPNVAHLTRTITRSPKDVDCRRIFI
ncbi:MAG: hypothetical protein A2Z39_00090 [Deltaproteobacteria bacterium RBG_19FT_COMBO_46_9]|nr:MAG: hypothetical protein A2Z39_00090 [Deltaproteobacteria bacterium RBG_19FT_COMBO_46_9]